MNNNMHRRVLLVQFIEDISSDLDERVSPGYGRYIRDRLEDVPASEDTSELLLIIQDIISDRMDQGDQGYVSHIRERLSDIIGDEEN